MPKNEAKIKFTADTGAFNDSIKQANNKMAELRAEMKLNETQMKATGTTVEGLENKHKILQGQLAASENKTAALSAKVEAAVRIFGENSEEASKLKTQLINAQVAEEKLRQSVSACEKEIKESSQATEHLDEALENVDNAARDAGEGFTVMKGVMADLVADGIEQVAEGLGTIAKESFEMASSMESATDDFVAKTGASTEAASEFEDAMIDIYNGNYGESFEDISNSMATVKQTMGDIGTDELENLTQKALIVRDTFDMDVNESIRGANSMMDQFGITGDDAFNLIAQGAQKGLNQNGDLLDVVNEYSVQFADAGFSAEQMFNMLANGAENGTWSVDKLGDAVKEYNIRVSDGTVADALAENRKQLGLTKNEVENLSKAYGKGGDEGKQAMRKTLDAVLSVEDETERYKLGVEMFGTMWEDLGEDAVAALFDTKGEISTTKDALGEINAVKYDNIGSALEGVKRNLQTSIAEPMKEDVMPAVNEFIEDVDWAGVGETISEVFGVIAEGALAIGSGIADTIGWMREHKALTIAIATAVGILAGAITAYNIVQGIKAAMDAAHVTTVWALVSAHIAQAAAAMAAIAPYVLIVAAIAAVIAIIVLCVKHWDKIKEVTKKVWEAIKKAVVNGAKAVKEAISKAWDAIKKATSKAWNAVKNAIVKIWEGIKKAAKATWDGIKKVFTAAVDLIKKIMVARFNLYKKIITTAWNVIKKVTTTVWNAIKKGIEKVVNGIKTTVSKVINAIKNTVSKVWNGIKNTTSKVWNGIKTAISKVVNTVKTQVTGQFNKVKNLVSNVWNGVKNVTSNVWNNIKSKVSNATKGVKNAIANGFGGLKSKISGIWQGIKTAMTNPIETAKNTLSRVVDKIKGIFNFSWSLPKPKIPKFSVSGGKAPWGVGGLGEMPSIKVKWNALGAVVKSPTLVGSVGDTIMGAGEAGAEAILPISVLQDYINNAFDRNVLSYAAAGGSGDVYNFYVNDATINDNAQMRDVAKDFITEMVRLGGMNR